MNAQHTTTNVADRNGLSRNKKTDVTRTDVVPSGGSPSHRYFDAAAVNSGRNEESVAGEILVTAVCESR